ATAGDDFGVKRVRFAEGTTTLGTSTLPPYAVNVTVPANAACNSTRTYSAVAMDSLGQTTSATKAVTVACGSQPAPTVTATATVTVGGEVTPAPKTDTYVAPSAVAGPSVSFVSWPRSVAGKSRVTFNASAPAGLKSASVVLGNRTLCTISA